MDDRQTKITEGAGLEESRLNQEFIDFLNKWGFRFLMVVLVIAAGWVGKTRWDQYVEQRLDTALVELESEIATGSPDGLIALAKKYKSVGSVWEQATLSAASINLESGRKSLIPGGDPSDKEDFLDPESAQKQLEQAADLFAQVVEHAGSQSISINALDARSGLIASKISLRDADGARSGLTELIALLEKSGFTDLKDKAEERLASLDELMEMPVLTPYGILAAVADQRMPIQMYGESMEEVEAIRSRMKSEEMIESKRIAAEAAAAAAAQAALEAELLAPDDSTQEEQGPVGPSPENTPPSDEGS